MDGGPRGNELVVWVDDEKRRDLFAELQMWQDPGSYANSAGVASDPEKSQHGGSVWFLVPTLNQASGSDSTRRLPRDRSNSPSVLSPRSRSRAACASVGGRRTSSRKSFHAGPS